MMQSDQRLLKWLLAAACLFTAWNFAKADEPKDQTIQELRSLSAAGLPQEVAPSDRAYSLIEKLDEETVDKKAAADELILWLFVKEPILSTSESCRLIDLHPAARSLIALGGISVPLLTDKLEGGLSEEDAELIITCLRKILGDKASDKIKEIESQTPSANVKQAAEIILEGGERRFNPVIYQLQHRR